jgi:hypothetical protein
VHITLIKEHPLGEKGTEHEESFWEALGGMLEVTATGEDDSGRDYSGRDATGEKERHADAEVAL